MSNLKRKYLSTGLVQVVPPSDPRVVCGQTVDVLCSIISHKIVSQIQTLRSGCDSHTGLCISHYVEK